MKLINIPIIANAVTKNHFIISGVILLTSERISRMSVFISEISVCICITDDSKLATLASKFPPPPPGGKPSFNMC